MPNARPNSSGVPRRRSRAEREQQLRHVSKRVKAGQPLSARRRFRLVARLARFTRLTPEQIAKLSNASVALAERIITHVIHEVPEKIPPLLDRPSAEFIRRLQQPGVQKEKIGARSRETEIHALRIFPKAILREPTHPGHDLAIPTSFGEIEIDVKQVIAPSEHAFFPLNTRQGKLKPTAGHLFMVFALDGLFFVRESDLKVFLEKYFKHLSKLRPGASRETSFIPLGELARLGFADKIPYREYAPTALVSVPKPPHFPVYTPAPQQAPFLSGPRPKRTPPTI